MYVRRFKPGKTRADIDAVLRFVIRSAATHIPMYRELLGRSNIDASRVTGISDLPRLPIIGKQAFFQRPLQQQLHAASKASRRVQTATSGFTGFPVSIYMNRAEATFRRAQVLASWRGLARFPLGLKVADLGTWVSVNSGRVFVRRGPISVLRLSIGLRPEEQAALLNRFNPHVISGTPTALDVVARDSAAMEARFPSLRLVATRGEVLFPPVRAGLEDAFGCRVADFYNCEEIGNVASECPKDSTVLHVNTDACILETVDDAGVPTAPGEEGKILLTSLANCTMPLIRYDVGDRGTLLSRPSDGRCICGRHRPRLKLVGGREDDYVFLPTGQRVSPRLVGTAVYRVAMNPQPQGGMQWLFRGFQVTQDALDHMTVRLIPESGMEIGRAHV